jgi:hypothetical protein
MTVDGVLFGSIVLPAVLFGVFYYPTLNTLARGLASPYAKANIGSSMSGRSIGKFLFGLVVIELETGRPCGRAGSAKRNVLFLLPGANLSAAFLEAVTINGTPRRPRRVSE